MLFKELNTRTRPFLTIDEIRNKWIWGSCRHVINVSKRKQKKKVVKTIKELGATYDWIPMDENEKLDINLICKAMKTLLSYDGEETIIHCEMGNNRSRLVCEFALYAKTGKWMDDDLSVGLGGCKNMTVYNIKRGYLPELEVVEKMIEVDTHNSLPKTQSSQLNTH